MNQTYAMSDTSGSPSPRVAKSEIIDQLKISVTNSPEFIPKKQAFPLPDYRSLSPMNKFAGSVMANPVASTPTLQ